MFLKVKLGSHFGTHIIQGYIGIYRGYIGFRVVMANFVDIQKGCS